MPNIKIIDPNGVNGIAEVAEDAEAVEIESRIMDARDRIAQTLRGIGFEVEVLERAIYAINRPGQHPTVVNARFGVRNKRAEYMGFRRPLLLTIGHRTAKKTFPETKGGFKIWKSVERIVKWYTKEKDVQDEERLGTERIKMARDLLHGIAERLGVKLYSHDRAFYLGNGPLRIAEHDNVSVSVAFRVGPEHISEVVDLAKRVSLPGATMNIHAEVKSYSKLVDTGKRY